MVAILPAVIYVSWEAVSQIVGASGPLTAGYLQRAPRVLTEPGYLDGIRSAYLPFTNPLLILAGAGVVVHGARDVRILLWLVSTIALNIFSGYATPPMIAYLLLPPVAFFAAVAVEWSFKKVINFLRWAQRRLSSGQETLRLRISVFRLTSFCATGVFVGLTAWAFALVPFRFAEGIRVHVAEKPVGDVREAARFLAERLGPSDRFLIAWPGSGELFLSWYIAEANGMHLRPVYAIDRGLARRDPATLAQLGLPEQGLPLLVVSTLTQTRVPQGVDKAEQARFTDSVAQTFKRLKTFGDGPFRISIFDTRAVLNAENVTRLWSVEGDDYRRWRPKHPDVSLSVQDEGGVRGLGFAVATPKPKEYYDAEFSLETPVDWSTTSSFSLQIRSNTPSAAAMEMAYVRLHSKGGGSAWYHISFPEGDSRVVIPLWQGPTWDYGLDLRAVQRIDFGFLIGLPPRWSIAHPVDLRIGRIEVTGG